MVECPIVYTRLNVESPAPNKPNDGARHHSAGVSITQEVETENHKFNAILAYVASLRTFQIQKERKTNWHTFLKIEKIYF